MRGGEEMNRAEELRSLAERIASISASQIATSETVRRALNHAATNNSSPGENQKIPKQPRKDVK
jgi:hypothetical protein